MHTQQVMMNTVVEAYRDGALVAGPIPYAGHPENARHLARRTGLAAGADFVRVLDEAGKEEQWSEHIDKQAMANLAKIAKRPPPAVGKPTLVGQPLSTAGASEEG
jgi:hypothetical protein